MSEMFQVIATGEARITETDDVVVEISSVIPEAIKIHARDLIVGDKLFDTMGGTHPIVNRRTTKSGMVKTTRHDEWVDRFPATDIVTVIPNGHLGRALVLDGSGSRQGFIETGFYSTLDEDRDINPLNYDQEVCS